MKKTIIVYYSMSGNVKQTAERLAAETGAELLALHPVKAYPDKGAKKYLWGGKSALMGEKPKLYPYSFNADRYDTVIFGAPVWASSFAPPLRTFIEDNREALAGKKLAAFVCYMGSGDKKALKKLKKALGTEVLAAEMVLVEPTAKPKEDSDAQLKAFCARLQRHDTD